MKLQIEIPVPNLDTALAIIDRMTRAARSGSFMNMTPINKLQLGCLLLDLNWKVVEENQNDPDNPSPDPNPISG